MQQYKKMENGGFVVRGTPWLSDVEDVLEDAKEESIYKTTVK